MNYDEIVNVINHNNLAKVSDDIATFIAIMDEHQEHIEKINLNHDIYNCKIRGLKNIINPTPDIIEKKANENKINEEAFKAKQDHYIDEINDLKEYINNIKTYESPNKKPVYNIDNAFTPAFIDFFCKTYGISHYAFDINKTCFMKYVHKNQNHRALCYYAMNNHMYLVKDKNLIKSMVEKAKAPEHKIHSSMLELDDIVNPFHDKRIYVMSSLWKVSRLI